VPLVDNPGDVGLRHAARAAPERTKSQELQVLTTQVSRII
jgi:hypothetical protein